MPTLFLFFQRLVAPVGMFFILLQAPFSIQAQTNRPTGTIQKPNSAQAFAEGEVKLLDGPFKESQDAEARYLLSLDLDRLLAPYRLTSALVPKATQYPGWESETLPGVALCFYLSGTARLYAMTGNRKFLTHINYIITELSNCQQRNNGFLLGTNNGKKILERVEKEGFFSTFGHWENGEATPYYSMEKLFSGLRDVYRICHIKKALTIAVSLGNWVAKHMSYISDGDLQKLMAIEYGGMNWVLADLYADTGDKRFLAMSRRWQDNITVNPAVNGHDVLNGKHANMQFPKFSGLAARYPYTGDGGDLGGAKFFWNSVVNHRSYVTGGNSESEYFGPRDSLSKRLSPFTTENCNEYNMLRLTKLLFEIEPRAEYADYMERTLFNHILSSQNPADGKVCYYLPLMPGAERVYQPLYESFKCCVCSAMDSYTRHADYIYSHDASGIFINLFIASELNYQEKGMGIRQETAFPDNNISKLIITTAKPVRTALYIRSPQWTNNGEVININGQRQEIKPSADGYLHIVRVWKNKDVIEIKLPMKLRTEQMPDDKNTLAIFYGPVLMAASLTQNEGDELVNANEAPALVPGNKPLKEWFTTSGNALNFATTIARPAEYTITPLFRKKTGLYSVYWKELSEQEWEQRTDLKQSKKDSLKEIDRHTIDLIKAAEPDSGQVHHLTGTSTIGYGNTGILKNQGWRASADSFGYELSVSDTGQNTLYCSFMGRQNYEEWSCRITVEGTTLEKFQRGKDDSYPVVMWDAAYLIPYELTRGRKKIRVMFEPIVPGKMQMPRLTELRTLKAS